MVAKWLAFQALKGIADIAGVALAPETGGASLAGSAAVNVGLDAAQSAEGGAWNTGGGGLYRLHPSEMVLPADIAGSVRSGSSLSFSGSSAAAGGASAASAINVGVSYNISALDGQSVQRMLLQSSGTIAQAVSQQIRNANTNLTQHIPTR
jgi:hypothetical protein